MNIYIKFYNVLADLIRWFEDNIESDFYIKYRGISVNLNKKINRELASSLPELIQKDTYQALEILEDERWNKLFFERFFCFIEECKKKKRGAMVLLRLISKLDKGLSERIQAGTDYLKMQDPPNCLNTNYAINGIMLLPRYQCLWERNSRGRQYGNGLMNDIKSLYYIRKEDLSGYSLKNIFLGKYLFQNNSNLKIGISPITKQDVLETSYYEKEEILYFKVDGLSNKETEIRDNVNHIIKKAKEAGVNILLFPEMLGLEEMLSDYRHLYEEDWSGDYPEFLIFPSIWNSYTNSSIVSGNDGSELGRQQKQNPYAVYSKEYETEAIEDLQPDRQIVLFHIEGIGRAVILICKDFLLRDYRRIMLDSLKTTFFMVPSFSTGYFDFLQAMGECGQYDCGVIWGNCCGAMNLENAKEDNFKDIGYVQFSGKLTDVVGRVSIEEGNRCSKKECKKQCLFIYDIPYKV